MAALDPTNYSKTRVITDRRLAREKTRYQRALGLCLLGSRCNPRRGDGEGPTGRGGARRRRRRQRNPFVDDEAAAESDEVGVYDEPLSPSPSSPEEEEEEEGEEEEGPPDLLFALTERHKNARIRNLLQLSAGILSWSKIILFDRISWLLRVCDPTKVEMMYCGESISAPFRAQGGRERF